MSIQDSLNNLQAQISAAFHKVNAGLSALDAAKLDAASYTAADVLAKLLQVDGAGSGLDADTLDGKQLAALESELKAYADQVAAAIVDASPETLDTLRELAAALGDDPNFAATVATQLGLKLDASAYTAADVLAKLLTVDGAGSGLNADLLDGMHAGEFATAAQGAKADSAVQPGDLGTAAAKDAPATGNATAAQVVLGSDTRLSDARTPTAHTHAIAAVTGLQSTLDGKVDKVSGKGLSTEDYTSAEKTKLAGIEAGATADQTPAEILAAIKTVDGAGSGLDADLLDGLQASAFAPASHSHAISNVTGLQAALDGKQAALGFTPENAASKGQANGYASLDATGKVPTAQLPSYVDDVLEYASLSAFPVAGETGKIYIALDDNKTYRWSGSAYIHINASVGSSDTATKLATARTIALSGDVTGSTSFDGSANVTITATVADDSHNHVISNVDGLQAALDGKLATTGTAAAATRLATARTLSLAGDVTGSATFDGSANASITVTYKNSGVTAGTYPKVTVDAKGNVTAGSALAAADIPPLDASKITSGTLSVGTSGNAATATKLATARTINGVAFDGTADITVADGTKLPLAGGTMTGKLSAVAPAASVASLSLPHGTAPTTLSNGDTWTTTSGIYVRINGVTRDLYHSGNLADVSQAEAEAGTATARRAWTSQRVRQAVAAYAPSKDEAITTADTIDCGEL